MEVNLIVVNAYSPYMAILGHPWIHTIGAFPSMLHQKIKFPTEDGIAIVCNDQKVVIECLVAAINHEIKQKRVNGSGAIIAITDSHESCGYG